MEDEQGGAGIAARYPSMVRRDTASIPAEGKRGSAGWGGSGMPPNGGVEDEDLLRNPT